MNFKNLAEQNENWIIEQRRYFHAHPELSFEEKNTTGQIGKLLEEMGLTPHYYPDYNGLWAMIEGGKATPESKTVALRADIDALPVDEHTGLAFCSQNPGVMHACGHDCHIAMLLGGIRMLMAKKEDLKGNVKIIFQAAEESCHGAQYYVEHGFLDDVDAIYGTHIWGDLDAPYMNFESGPRMVGSIFRQSFFQQLLHKFPFDTTSFSGNSSGLCSFLFCSVPPYLISIRIFSPTAFHAESSAAS